MLRPVVIVMAKAPQAGEAKTRLGPMLSPAEAASLAACFVQDAVTNARRVLPETILAYTPASGRAILEGLLPRDLIWLAQEGADLGERLEHVTTQAAQLGFGPLLITGTDSPTLPPAFIETARRTLTTGEADITLGPTEDGGYYLVGLRQPFCQLFDDIDWSTPLVFQQTADNAARLKLKLFRLPLWYDVDTPADLLRLHHQILEDTAARERAPATSQWLLARASL